MNEFSNQKGGLGQLGPGLAEVFAQKYGHENIILSDIVKVCIN